MRDFTRRQFVKTGSMAGALLVGPGARSLEAQAGGFTAASNPGGPEHRASKGPGVPYVYALRETTGGGTKVFGVAVQYDAPIRTASLSPDTYAVSVFQAPRGSGMMGGPGTAGPGGAGGAPAMADAQQPPAVLRQVAAIYTNTGPALRADRASVPGAYVIVELVHDPDLSTPSLDSDKVSVVQTKPVTAISGAAYPANATAFNNSSGHGNDSVVRGLDGWEQNHWWWDDAHATYLEYSIYLPKSFLQPGGENKSYPLLIAITHSGTSYDGTCEQTLTDGVIASIWAMPDQQAAHECVVITPRYERTTMNDYWEHTYDVENTWRLVDFLISNKWNYGNPNRPDRADKTLKIDRQRVYTTGWSMGAMTSLWMMAKHPETFAGGLIIAGQQRPADVVTLAHQNVLIITGDRDDKATPWNEKCVPVWQQAGARVVRPQQRLEPADIFPVDDQARLDAQVNGYLGQGGNITFLTFAGVDHMGSARKFFYIKAARDWLFRQQRSAS